MEDGIATKRRYFAAANGYRGFRSYFPRVFDSSAYRRIFVLKGGPGTGKSSLMKKITRAFPDGAYRTEAIFCSSDPDSLDGVIVESKRGRVAVLDGTAPHERDAVIPGAIDEIVNLGEAWNAGALEARREEILSLTKEKSARYRDAYSYLAAFGKTRRNFSAENERCDTHAMREKILELLGHPSEDDVSPSEYRLIRAFGLRGEVLLPTFRVLAENTCLLRGSAAHKARVLYEVQRILEEKRIHAVIAPSPFDAEAIDGILAEGARIGFLAVGEDGIPLDADAFFESRGTDDVGDFALLLRAKGR
ncbi:MAG TPA: hypothetical protein DDY70_05720, partial [Clostridiales bacterium]|nr:hypothetical protein [Clostridiales bacterium]